MKDQGQTENGENGSGSVGRKGHKFHYWQTDGDDGTDEGNEVQTGAVDENHQAGLQNAVDEAAQGIQPLDRFFHFVLSHRAIQQPARQPKVLPTEKQLQGDQQHEYPHGRWHARNSTQGRKQDNACQEQQGPERSATDDSYNLAESDLLLTIRGLTDQIE